MTEGFGSITVSGPELLCELSFDRILWIDKDFSVKSAHYCSSRCEIRLQVEKCQEVQSQLTGLSHTVVVL